MSSANADGKRSLTHGLRSDPLHIADIALSPQPDTATSAIWSGSRAGPLAGRWRGDDDLASFLASAEDMDRYIDAVTAIADSVGA
ncbi:hypothetical protein ACWCO3_21660, partial [Micromonospora sp. NPDC002411]